MNAVSGAELERERAYADRVRRALLEIISKSDTISHEQMGSIRSIISDAWEELRLRPTQLSPQDLRQLSADVDRYVMRKQIADESASRYARMLRQPFFARTDFRESGSADVERIMLGIYSVKDEKGALLVCDWRAPVGDLFYECLPGPASYTTPSGRISGELLLKRQYGFTDGCLEYYADTTQSISDSMLLDVLSSAATPRMKQIVSTIQAEQNHVIRTAEGSFLGVVGGAGSGKTSVALHRAAYLIYRSREKLDSSRIQIMSPSTAFSEYISDVLPELGEKNIRSLTLYEMVTHILGKAPETPEAQQKEASSPFSDVRLKSVREKGDMRFLEKLQAFADNFEKLGPAFSDIAVEDRFRITKDELSAMYRQEFSVLNPAQRLERIRQSLGTRMEDLERELRRSYENSFSQKYRGRELKNMVNLAVSARLQPIQAAIAKELRFSGTRLLCDAYDAVLSDESKAVFLENEQSGVLWWEDAVTQAFLALRLGFAQSDRSILHLLVDEAQDYTETALKLLRLAYPSASVTCLGDPMQRTAEGLPPCDSANWIACFGGEGTLLSLTKCYRSTKQVAGVLAAVLPEAAVQSIGRDGESVHSSGCGTDEILAALEDMRSRYRSVAVLTRTQNAAEALSMKLPGVYRLDGGNADAQYVNGDTVVSCFQNVKGLEFDAVVVVWDAEKLDFAQRRRLYTACSRAMHSLWVCAPASVRREIGL